MTRALLVAAALLAPGLAHADPCADSTIDPVAAPLRDGGFDATRAACLRADVDVRLAGHVLLDTPDFYGTAGGELELGIRFLEKFGLEWGAQIRVIDVTFAQTAVLPVTEASYGPVAVHAAIGHEAAPHLRLAGFVHVELPFTRSPVDLSTAGAQLAGLVTAGVTDRIVLHGRAGALGWYGSSSGGLSRRGGFVASVDAGVRALPWLVGFAGLEAQVGWHGPGLDHVAGRLGVHWRVRGPWRVELGASVPMTGEERTDAVVVIGVRRDR